tara:strand:- start:1948 stop:2484 length:537 start_codon:yes stop_codon:yes gene_type:complete
MKILLVSTCSEKLSEYEFVFPIAEIIKPNEYKIINYKDLDKMSLLDYDKIIICGTSLQDNDYLNYMANFKNLTNFNKPILGICSGFQILCVTFGERIVDSKEIGMTNVITTQNNPLISGGFQAYNMHNFSAKIPITFKTLAKTEETIQLVSHKELNIFGVLFHPEVRNEQIVTNFLLI